MSWSSIIRTSICFFTFFIMSFFTDSISNAGNNLYERELLTGLDKVKAVYDIQVKEAKTFAFFLSVIAKTHDSIQDQGVQPEFVVTVRGPAIRFISNEIWSYSEEDQKHLKQAAETIARLHQDGVKFEACSIAADLFNITKDTYIPGVKPVPNTFVSLTGYQAHGYGIVVIN
ncbi:DsrE family protein [Desulfogranum japonicum]|uniref:DsrE family protein n=1 Tax=Desulfogranum japonicum TaxID=231447 RepID=UPI0003FFB2B2|nr:DsrE family protein [Desulfogranum japonicum]